MRKTIFLFFASAYMLGMQAQQFTDRITLGNSTSELSHGLTTYDPAYTATVSNGFLGECGRYCKPYYDNPYAGIFKNVFGGEYSFVMKVDGNAQNYITARISGSDSNDGRYMIDVDNRSVGELVTKHDPISKGAFVYFTLTIPRKETDGKKEVVVRVRAKGRFYSYGTRYLYTTYQRVMEADNAPIYTIYSHTNPSFEMPADEAAGKSTPYEEAPANSSSSLSAIRAELVATSNSQVTSLINGSDFIKSDGNNFYNTVAYLGVAYHTKSIASGYKSIDVVNKIKRVIDQMIVHRNSGDQLASGSWGGAYGYQGYACYLIKEVLSDAYLDEAVDLGAGIKTRRAQWIEAFKESFDFGASTRKTITNQIMECSMSTYGASLALYALDPITFAEYPKIGLRLAREACGLEEFTGPVIGLTANKPELGDPATSYWQGGFYDLTTKGTGREEGWTCASCYGNLGPKLVEFWDMTRYDPYLKNDNGDSDFLKMAATHERTQSLFTYPWIDSDGNRCILSESVICWRNQYEPGKKYYGNLVVSGMTADKELLGHIWQMYNDGQQDWASSDKRRVYTLYLPQCIDSLQAHTNYTQKMSSTPGEPDYVAADEENGILAIKKGKEMIFINFWNWNNMKAHHVSSVFTKNISCLPDRTEYFASGATTTTSTSSYDNAHGIQDPDTPIPAGAGVTSDIPSYCHTLGVYHTQRVIKDFYQSWYNKFLIGMNTTANYSYNIEVPEALQGKTVYNMTTKESVTLGALLPVPARSTTVLFLGEDANNSTSLTDTNLAQKEISANTSSLATRVTELTSFAQAHADSISIYKVQEMFPHDAFLDFMRELTFADYAANSGTLSQVRVDSALVALNDAYALLRSKRWSGSYSDLPGKVNFFTSFESSGKYTLTTDSLLKGIYRNTYLVLPVRAQKEGLYTFKARISSKCPQSVTPRVNITFFDEKGYYLDSTAIATGTRYLATNADWSDYQDYTWSIYLTAGQKKLMKLSTNAEASIRVAEIASISATVQSVTPSIQCGSNAVVATDSAQVLAGTIVKMFGTPVPSEIGGTYLWSDGSTRESLTVQAPDKTTIYTLTYISPGGSKSITTYKIVVYRKNQLPDGAYYFRNAETGLYYTNPCSNYTADASDIPTFQAKDPNNLQAQIWNFTLDAASNRYKITSEKDGRYLNEHGALRNRTYSSAWNSYTLYNVTSSDKYVFQNGGSTGTKYWYINAEGTITGNGTTDFPEFPFLIISKQREDVAISEITMDRFFHWQADGKLCLQTDAPGELSIYDIKGKLIDKVSCQNGLYTYSMTPLAPGVYCVTFITLLKIQSFKLIKK